MTDVYSCCVPEGCDKMTMSQYDLKTNRHYS